MFKRKNVVLNRGPPISDRSSDRTPTLGNAHNGAPGVARRGAPTNADRPMSSLIRPSLLTSAPCATSGSRTLDKALGHGGVPLGSLTLVLEHGTTDFSAAILKSGAAISVTSARTGSKAHVICVGLPDWLRALPSLTTKRSGPPKEPDARMKIAWRYAKYASDQQTDVPSKFAPDVDFKSTLVPAPQQSEISYVLGASLDELLSKIEKVLDSHKTDDLVRVLVPSFLHPAVYSPESCSPTQILPFVAQLRELLRTAGNAVGFVTIPLQLFPRTRSIVAGAELLADTCVELEPFDSGDEKVQGFLHINRIAKISDKGINVEQRRELAFYLGRYQFEVSPYAIPVEIEETEKETW